MSNPPERTISVLVVDDSRAQRELLVNLLRESGQFTIAGTAANGRDAVDATIRLRPDVIAMDIHLPVMDGFEATRRIMEQCPTPVVMISSSTSSAERRAAEAVAAGALAVTPKPGGVAGLRIDPVEGARFLRTLRTMAGVRLVTRRPTRILPPQPVAGATGAPQLLAIAASTGGPAAVQSVLRGLGADYQLPVIVAQHIARGFLNALVDWLSSTVPLRVKIASPGERMLPGYVYMPCDNAHLMVHSRGVLALRPCSALDRYCPSADTLFESVARNYSGRAIGVILTGMGDDGSRGLQLLRQSGAAVFAQDEASCVVYGMPKAAVELGVVSRVLALDQMPAAIRELSQPPG